MKKIIGICICFQCFMLNATSTYFPVDDTAHKTKSYRAYYDVFVKELIVKCQYKKLDWNNDKCLRSFFSIPLTQLMSELKRQSSKKKLQDYSSIQTKFKTNCELYLSTFLLNEQETRIKFEQYQIKNNSSNYKQLNELSPQSVCNNQNFETGDFTGWQVTSNAGGSYVTSAGPDPDLPFISRVYHGSHSACLNALTNSSGIRDSEIITQTFLVTPDNANYIFYVAVIMDAEAHECNENGYFNVNVKDASGNIIPCSNINLIASDEDGFSCSIYNGWQSNNQYDYLGWSPVIVPLQNYIGQNVTISMEVYRCNFGGHGARAYVEASCTPYDITEGNNVICNNSPVSLSVPFNDALLYQWNLPNGSTNNSYNVSSNLPGAHTVTISLASNPTCKIVLDTVIVKTELYSDFSFTTSACTSLDVPVNSTFTVVSNTNDSIIKYNWNWGDGIVSNTNETNHLFPSEGVYNVTFLVETLKGCKHTTTKTVTLSVAPSLSITNTNPCVSQLTKFQGFTIPTTSIQSYVWSWGDGSQSNSGGASNQQHVYNQVGTYTVNYFITTTMGCTVALTHSVEVYPTPIANFVATPTLVNFFDATIDVTNQASNDVEIWHYNFDDGGISTNENPSHTYTSYGLKNIIQTVTNMYGCAHSESRQIKVIPEFRFWIPNSFTPHNPDELNDVFKPKVVGVEEYEFLIYNRWGDLIYKTNNPEDGWDGYFKGKQSPIDVYIWNCEFKNVVSNKREFHIGHVTLLD